MSDAGFVRIYRTLLGHPSFRNDAEAMAFAWMVIRASWRPVRVRYKGGSVDLERGQLAVSVRDLAEALDRPKGWIERLLTRLKSGTMIETHSKTGVNVITICNYDEYQAEKKPSKTPRKTARKTDAGQGQDTEQRMEEGNKEEPSGSSTPIAPKMFGEIEVPDWVPAKPFDAFVAMRKKKDAMPTDHAVELLIAKLDRLRGDGHDPGDVLDQSTMNNWTGIFEIKDRRNGSFTQPPRNPHPDEPSNPFVRAAAERQAERAAAER